MVEVSAEASQAHALAKIGPARRYQSYVDQALLRAAERSDLSVFYHSKQPHLNRRGQLGHFVEE